MDPRRWLPLLLLTLPITLGACDEGEQATPSVGVSPMTPVTADAPAVPGLPAPSSTEGLVPAATVNGFYIKTTRSDECPAGGGSCSMVGALRADCLDGDFATGGAGWAIRLSEPGTSIISTRPVGTSAWKAGATSVAQDFQYLVRVICVDL